LINKYVKNNTCAFLDKKNKDAFIAELNQIQAQKLNDTALDLILEDTSGIKLSLHAIAKQHNYTVLIFFDPNCEHCKVELPKMDSTIKVLEKELLIKIGKYAVCNEPNIDKAVWKEFILNNKLDDQYTHVIMSSNNENLELRKAYDAFTNPLFYLLDKDGILIAKKLSTNTLRKILIQSFRNFKN
jgi:cytochrome oxidase Cu insertion factor (SCO1/SenC/PrrC family)